MVVVDGIFWFGWFGWFGSRRLESEFPSALAWQGRRAAENILRYYSTSSPSLNNHPSPIFSFQSVLILLFTVNLLFLVRCNPYPHQIFQLLQANPGPPRVLGGFDPPVACYEPAVVNEPAVGQ